MLELSRQRPVSVRVPTLSSHHIDMATFHRAEPGPTVQLIARDAFVAETAIRLDQLLLEIKSLSRDLQILKSDIAELRDDATQTYKFSEFVDREHRARSTKMDELIKKFDNLKLRFDTLDGPSKGDFHAFRTFESVSRRLTELGSLERDFRRVAGQLKFSAGFFAASLLAWVGVVWAF